MSTTTNEILEKLKSITLLEAAELVSQIEETFGVDASAPAGGGMVMAMPGAAGGDAGAAAEEKTTFDVVLEDVPADKRVPVLKIIRNLTSLDLKEAKEAITTLPNAIIKGVSKEDAEAAKQQLEETGSKVTIS
jgi:large subunit ribosomal protein L7/L12